MPRFYIEVEDDLFYQFNAPATAYPAAVATELGVRATRPPSPAKVTRAGIFADWGILRVRMPIVDASTGLTLRTVIRLCDVDNFSDAVDNLAGSTAFGGQIEGVYPVRKRLLI